MSQQWTFEKLAKADKGWLERLMTSCEGPNAGKLQNLVYCGWNHDRIGKISGEKFKKGFVENSGEVYGYNEVVKQDGKGFAGTWDTKIGNNHAAIGYFKVSRVGMEEETSPFYQYSGSALFNYNIGINKWHHCFFRPIRDFVILPNPNDHSLLLGKAFVKIGFKLYIPCCYFILGFPQPAVQRPPHF